MKYEEYTNKMQWLMFAFVVVLFVALTPGVLLRLPPGGSKLVVALTHGVVFALVLYLTKGFVRGLVYGRREGMADTHSCPKGTKQQEDGRGV
jgi:hypothetical protein